MAMTSTPHTARTRTMALTFSSTSLTPHRHLLSAKHASTTTPYRTLTVNPCPLEEGSCLPHGQEIFVDILEISILNLFVA